ncbi:hypothetical protein BaRGS_00010444, partial [Batillaria attramentaria]
EPALLKDLIAIPLRNVWEFLLRQLEHSDWAVFLAIALSATQSPGGSSPQPGSIYPNSGVSNPGALNELTEKSEYRSVPPLSLKPAKRGPRQPGAGAWFGQWSDINLTDQARASFSGVTARSARPAVFIGAISLTASWVTPPRPDVSNASETPQPYNVTGQAKFRRALIRLVPAHRFCLQRITTLERLACRETCSEHLYGVLKSCSGRHDNVTNKPGNRVVVQVELLVYVPVSYRYHTLRRGLRLSRVRQCHACLPIDPVFVCLISTCGTGTRGKSTQRAALETDRCPQILHQFSGPRGRRDRNRALLERGPKCCPNTSRGETSCKTSKTEGAGKEGGTIRDGRCPRYASVQHSREKFKFNSSVDHVPHDTAEKKGVSLTPKVLKQSREDQVSRWGKSTCPREDKKGGTSIHPKITQECPRGAEDRDDPRETPSSPRCIHGSPCSPQPWASQRSWWSLWQPV